MIEKAWNIHDPIDCRIALHISLCSRLRFVTVDNTVVAECQAIDRFDNINVFRFIVDEKPCAIRVTRRVLGQTQYELFIDQEIADPNASPSDANAGTLGCLVLAGIPVLLIAFSAPAPIAFVAALGLLFLFAFFCAGLWQMWRRQVDSGACTEREN